MTFEEFLETLPISYTKEYDENSCSPYRKTIKDGKPAIYINWSTGGISGGSCWNERSDNRYYPSKSEDEPDFDTFDELVEFFIPDIKFMEYKKLYKTLVKIKDYSTYDYYGNYSDYREKYMFLEDFYNALKERGYIDGSQ